MNTHLDRPVLIASIRLLPADESGNSNPVFSGWRPLLYYIGDEESRSNGTEIRFDNVPQISSGETVTCVVRLMYSEYHVGLDRPKQPFALKDGNRVRAHGVIIEVLGMETSQ